MKLLPFKKFAEGYVAYTTARIRDLSVLDIEPVIHALIQARERGSTIFLIGNGGSAAIATHFAQDLSSVGTVPADLPAPFLKGVRAHLASAPATVPFQPFRAISLTDNFSLISALGNDRGYEHIFTGQLQRYYRPGDMLVAISSSGNSPNIIQAINYVKERGGVTVGVVGFDGGKAKSLCDHCIYVPADKGAYGPVEFLHLALVHLIRDYLKIHFER